jgi:outer membrane protein, multidrug efflux system
MRETTASFLARRSGRVAPLAAAWLLAACAFTPTYERPAAPVPLVWPHNTEGMEGAVATEVAWRDFAQDERLRQAIALALLNNRDLRVATLNIEQVRALYQVQSAARSPTLNAALTGNRQSAGDQNITSAYSAGLVVSGWELDFFGRIASLKEAALAQYLASEEARNATQTSLVASVISTWLSLQTTDELLALSRRTAKARVEALRLTQLRLDSGVASALELRQAESLLGATRATLAQQERQRAIDLNALSLLVGQVLPISALPVAADTAASLSEVAAGVSSEVLMRRADVRAAEQQLIAANAHIGAARAAFFPRISLTASLGTASTALSGLFEGGSWGFALAPQALLPIFDAGRNQAALEVAQAQRDIALAQYEKAIQTAFREVADALAGRQSLTQQVAAQQAQALAQSQSLELAELRYRNGVASYLDVLDAQRALFAVQQALAQTRLAQQQNRVALFKALGGGWQRPKA